MNASETGVLSVLVKATKYISFHCELNESFLKIAFDATFYKESTTLLKKCIQKLFIQIWAWERLKEDILASCQNLWKLWTNKCFY